MAVSWRAQSTRRRVALPQVARGKHGHAGGGRPPSGSAPRLGVAQLAGEVEAGADHHLGLAGDESDVRGGRRGRGDLEGSSKWTNER